MKPTSPKPLSDDELDQLDHLLLDLPGQSPMDIACLDGFLTALICGPTFFTPSTWLAWVWDSEKGKQQAKFTSQEDALRILDLIFRHMNDLSHVLRVAPQHYAPLLSFNHFKEGDVVVLDEWCWGFMKGVALDKAGWQVLEKHSKGVLNTMHWYGTPKGWDTLQELNLSIEQHITLADGIADTVRFIYLFFEKARAKGIHKASQSTALEISSPDMRIDHMKSSSDTRPCFCDSGLPFTICHGAAHRLH